MNLKDTVKLSNGVEMPRLGFGVWKVKDGDEAVNSVKWAIEAGYVSIDTAAAYKNEEGVGQAIKESGVNREDLFVTTKLWNAEQGYESTLAAFDESLRKLELDYVDLYLIHWPVKGKFKDTWRAFEKLYNDKRVRAIGVCNFHEHHLKELMEDAEITPMVNQIELHPELTQEPLRNYCEEHNIVVEAWSPLGNGKLLDNAEIKAIAETHEKSVAQVILRWDLQIGVVTIPKSVHQERIVQNADIFDFELTEAEVAKISALNKDKRTGPDPDNFNF
ncbi:aldo/keto reductase [Listeria ivanovii]|uniref:aldo/keto reductase n=1 Tax=Listeria ivanovii TaxID=1638 RepID=UPI00051276DF|nr:aldo/keto reductase [Listeria ivanovii]AIS62082.1 glyoxal reductase [Listeria ivanovii subsp. londoniensis]MBK1965549.1 aldo/keto reductase [Listeria ivanovii subsp. londoniensis]MBK1983374.1 aldo/keto reductase [Listeria ivanovii subsp. londoniensis]MBK1994716.1 aldo/keto reductase [Listeria ivanovii subsp. londoniensis]MBM5719783.1 aldo/keto reductase [Listeria ivanovii]